MALSEEKIVELVNQEFEDSMGVDGRDLSAERTRNLQYYLRRLYGNEVEGESSVVTSDVSDVVDGIMPSLLRMFTTADNLVSFDAFGPEDEQAAEQESDRVSHEFFKRNPAFEILYSWFFDALVQRVGYVKAYWNEQRVVTTEEYDGLFEDELIELLMDEELEAVERAERTEQVQTPAGPVDVTVYDVKFKRTTVNGRGTVENVPPDEMRISSDANRVDPSSATMVGHERDVRRCKLLEMGFDKKKVNALPAEGRKRTTETNARKDKSDEQVEAEGTDDKSQDLICLREAYQYIDVDEDGHAELKQVFIANGKLLEMSDFDRQPFHAICPHPIPHKHVGLATADKVADNQLITSTLLRQIMMNLYHTNNPGGVVWEQAVGETTLEDLTNRRVGRIAQVKRPVGESYQPDVVPFTAAASFPMLEYFDKVKRDRTGVSADSEGLSPDDLKHIQTTVMAQATDISKMKVEAIARIFAETGLKTLFLHLHELLQKHQRKEEVIKLRGQWVPVKPSAWRTRSDMTVNIGLGIGTREQNLLHLNTIWDKQSQMVAGGGMNLTVTPKNIYNTAAEIVKNANLKLPQMFFTDPGDQKGPPPSDQQSELQKQQMALEARRQQLDEERNKINAAKLQLQQEKLALEHQRDMLQLREKAEERLDKYATENERLKNELTKMRMDADVSDVELALKGHKTDAEVESLRASAVKSRAEAAKIMEEAEGQSIENAAAESGVKSLVERDGGSEETD